MSNGDDIEFISGLSAKAPHQNAPDFVKAKLSIKRWDLIEWLQGKDGEWINADIKVSRAGSWYVAVDNWQPDPSRGNGSSGEPVPQQAASKKPDFDDDIPW